MRLAGDTPPRPGLCVPPYPIVPTLLSPTGKEDPWLPEHPDRGTTRSVPCTITEVST